MLVALSALVALALPVQKAAPSDISGVKNAYPGLLRGFETKNWASVQKQMLTDFVHVTPTHAKFDKVGYIKNCTEQFGPLSKIKFRVKLLKFSKAGSDIAADLTYVFRASFLDAQGKHSLKASGSETHYWRKPKATWLLSRIDEHMSKTEIDGKIVDVSPHEK